MSQRKVNTRIKRKPNMSVIIEEVLSNPETPIGDIAEKNKVKPGELAKALEKAGHQFFMRDDHHVVPCEWTEERAVYLLNE